MTHTHGSRSVSAIPIRSAFALLLVASFLTVPGSLVGQAGFGLGLPQWQVNQASAHLDIDSVSSSVSAPIDVRKCVDEAGDVNFISTNSGMPWELALSLRPGVPLGAGGQLTAGGQVVNVDMADPAMIFVFDQAYTNSFVPFTFSFRYPVIFEVYAQMGVMDPVPADGVALSAFNGLHVEPRGVLPGPMGDDDVLQVHLSEPPLCLDAPISFYGQQYDEMFISANGCVTFQGAGTSQNASSAQMQFGVPRVAAFWVDLRPDLGGSITAAVQSDVLTVEWLNVPQHPDMELVSCAISFDLQQGSVRIEDLDLPGPHPETAITGISRGFPSQNLGMTDFASLAGLGVQDLIGSPNRMVYSAFSSPMPALPGVSAIEFPQSNGDQVEVFAAP